MDNELGEKATPCGDSGSSLGNITVPCLVDFLQAGIFFGPCFVRTFSHGPTSGVSQLCPRSSARGLDGSFPRRTRHVLYNSATYTHEALLTSPSTSSSNRILHSLRAVLWSTSLQRVAIFKYRITRNRRRMIETAHH